jgi:hypothetical protein
MKTQSENQSAGDSLEQRTAEPLLIAALGERLGIELTKHRFRLPLGGWLEIDGMCESPLVLCEAWAHLGRPKSAQKNKVMTDAIKLMFAAKLCSGSPRMVLLFADEQAASHFKSRSWMAQLLQANGVEVQVVGLPETVRTNILVAQKRQFR